MVTLGAPLVPHVEGEFDAQPETAQWSYTITLLVGATSTPLLGRLADGRRRRQAVILVCLLVTTGCWLSALAGSFTAFLAGRALQGVAVALVPMAIATARDVVSDEGQSVRLVALLSVTTALGAGLGYPVTTLLVDHIGLRAPYAAAGAMCLAVSAATLIMLPRTDESGLFAPLDVRGAVVLMAAIASGLLGLSEGDLLGWTDPRVLGLAACSVALLAAWVRMEHTARHPLVELRLLGRRNVLAANLVGLLMGVSLYNTPVLVTRIGLAPEATSYGAGLTLSAIGVVMLPIAFGNYIGSRAATAVAAVWGRRIPLACGAAVAGLGPLALLDVQGRTWLLVVAMTLSAVGAGATFGTLPGLIVASVGPNETGSATSMNILLRTLGGAVGSAATGALVGAHPGAKGLALAALACAACCLLAVVVATAVPERRSTSTTWSALLEPVPHPGTD